MTRPKLLLADDSLTIRKVVELTFADEGIEVTSAADAQTAMERFVEVQPDIVLVDVGLDGTNGYQICEMIKTDEATRHIPVMLLVGSFEPFDGDEAHRVGADAFMTKPFNSIRDLVNRVSMLLTLQDTNGSATSASDLSTSTPDTPKPETEDIEDLYRSSLSEKDDTEQMDTVESFHIMDDLLGDAGMDDDMIEASYLAPPLRENSAETTEPVKEFDWSPEAIVETERPAFQPASNEKDLDPSEWLDGEDAKTDEIQRSSGRFFDFSKQGEPVGTATSEQGESDPSTFETVDFSNSPAVVPQPLSAAVLEEGDEDELLDIFDEHNRSSADDFTIHDTIPYSVGEQPPGPSTEQPGSSISDEMIEEIVRRVVHKLSDVVVRDIARIEVPRIAEKLIREALNQESKE